MMLTRREMLKSGLLLGIGATFGSWPSSAGATEDATALRRYHLSISVDALDKDPALIDLVREAGVTDIWLVGFLYGHWYVKPERIGDWMRRVRAAGLAAHIINVPLGHPEYNLQATSAGALSPTANIATPPGHWKTGRRPDGRECAGVSLHEPATAENVVALGRLKPFDPGIIMLDDDFRLAPTPGDIGGCFCDEHRARFLAKHGYGESQWAELLDAVGRRELTPILRAWLEDACDELTASFRAQAAVLAPEARLGTMVMFMGSERAGIRLADYHDVPLRVGEMMFDDASFGAVRNKTSELFSVLLHRRFARPELAFSETTAYPPDRLSAANMAAKLTISTISDVRNTMFMSGLDAFPRTHWATLGPAMKRQAGLHATVAGHAARGPFKHYWGEEARYVGDAEPYSLFLASGVPFEVCAEPAREGWTFLAEADARAVAAGRLKSPGTQWVVRNAPAAADGRAVSETLEALWAFKREIRPQLDLVPFVEEETPVVCAWYPTARAVLLWNLSEEPKPVTLRWKDTSRPVTLGPLGSEIVRDLR
jgi:hypothetical protein